MTISYPNDFDTQRSGGLGDIVLHAMNWLGDLRRQSEVRRAERLAQDELAAMSPRERLDIDVTAGNLIWSDERR